MRLVFRVLAGLLVLVLLGALAGLGLAWWLAARSLPDYDADWRVEGVRAPVDIVRDARAVPHIFADSDADAFFAFGWAHAEERLWQMELHRRTAQGRLAEIFGADALPLDRTMRALDLHGYARGALRRLSPDTRALLEAYADGVNARIRAVNDDALGRGAPEFFLFAREGLAPWTAVDSLSLVKLLALRLTSAAQAEVGRARLLSVLTPDQLADLDPEAPEPALIAPDLPPPEPTGSTPRRTPRREPVLERENERAESPASRRVPAADVAATDLAARLPSAGGLLEELSPFPPPGFGGASNAWAVSAERAAAGAPLLATDPHLWLSAPSVWMLARITSPGFDVIGGSVPGVPAILIGRNDAFGWGLTTAQVDDQDVYVERVNPDDPLEYKTPGGWERFGARQETIRVKDAPAETLLVRTTRHGPVMPPDGELGLAAAAPPGHVAALSWTALTSDDRSIESALNLMRARSLEDGVEAAALHLAPAQNVVMADASGVGMVTAGDVPVRSPASRSEGRVPSSGWVQANDWIGRMPRDALPRLIRPEGGSVANANNRTTDEAFPLHLTHDWPAPYRIRRIGSRLAARDFHTRESFVDLQQDVVSEMARAVLPLIARDLWWGEPAEEEGETGSTASRRRNALSLLRDWNGEMATYEPAPLIFHAWMRALTRRLAEDELGAMFPEIAGLRPLFVERVFHDVDGAGAWCDVVMTPALEDCAVIARRALDDALTELADRFGGGPENWRWGEAHRAIHRHTPLGWFAGLDLLVNLEHESPGGDHTVNVGLTPGRGPQPELNVHAPGFRAVYDFADLDRSLFVMATGESGHPFSRRYDDMNALWRRGEYIPMSLDPSDARAGALGVATLSPTG